jgi:hypothetical protein
MNQISLEIWHDPLADYTGDQFTMCLAVHFWNLDQRFVELRNSSGRVVFSFNFRFMDRTFPTPPVGGFLGDFWVMAFDIVYLITKVRILLPEWKYVCLAVDPLAAGGSRVNLSIDGRPVGGRLIRELAAATNGGRRLDLSQTRIHVKFGSVGLVNLYRGVEQVAAAVNTTGGTAPAALGSCGSPGTALAWTPALDWNYPRGWPPGGFNFTRQVIAGDVCTTDNKNGVLLVIPLYLKVAVAYGVCSRLGQGGKIPAYSSPADWRAAFNTAAAAVAATSSFEFLWQPYHRADNDTFVSRYEPSLRLNPGMWIPGQPNNPDEKCVLCDRVGCWDKYCEDEQPFVCQFPAAAPPLLRLRGLCRATSLDTMYYPTNRLGDLTWMGLTTSYIRFDHVEQRWEVRVSGSDTWAYSEVYVLYKWQKSF